MAMQQPPLLLGPGGQPVQTTSNFVCLVCGDRPKIAPALQTVMPGAPECIMTRLPDETDVTYNCAVCWNKFWAEFTRQHAPALVRTGEATDDAESR